jgi:hypothetical protein
MNVEQMVDWKFGIIMRISDYRRGFVLNLLTPYTHNSGQQATQRYRWSTHFTVHHCTQTRVLSLR